MDAVLIRRAKRRLDDLIIEIVIWELPKPVRGSSHRFKYRLFFGRSAQRIIAYDNERGKGDHRHIGNREMKYEFIDLETLEADFNSDIATWRARQ